MPEGLGICNHGTHSNRFEEVKKIIGRPNNSGSLKKHLPAGLRRDGGILRTVYIITLCFENSWKFQVSNEASAGAWLWCAEAVVVGLAVFIAAQSA